ncbi:hypothetical protein BS47DRAFT_1325784 [Hydnum rufescens UP504]|uniref:Glutathione hydrolase n=1 Tax=Hydnum rufescens UP504 TaxID=1448309 RepID=A0A9P6B5B8_9AGAM|nr:hypothetical protein BS47DRAFT_1325784 [Hydnum rufescens UP504]
MLPKLPYSSVDFFLVLPMFPVRPFVILTLLSSFVLVRAVRETHGAVACEAQVCSDVGASILKLGGNAADAMVATVLCVGTVDGHHSGIGGGGFALVRSPTGRFTMIDFRETAPALSNETMYSNNPNPHASTVGGLAVGVPGELRGLEYLHKNYGKLPWKTLFQPAIKLARDGFILSPQIAGGIASIGSTILNDSSFRAVYSRNGTLLKSGDTAYRPTYARTLEAIATSGSDVFYDKRSWIARASVRAVKNSKAQRGILSLQDLHDYKVEIREPANINYRGYKLTSTVAPSSGTVVLSALNILDGYNLTYYDNALGIKSDSNLTAHRLVESMKYAYGQRTTLGDPKFVGNVSTLELEFLTPQVGAEIRASLSDNSTGPPSRYDPSGYNVLATHGTSHLVTADEDGLVVSLTTTINLYFGSLIMVPETGVILNNEMDDFSSPGSSNSFGYIATPANYIVPGKRPLSSMSPLIAEDAEGTFVFATGAAGGSAIITANLQVTHHYLDHGLSAQQAIDQPRLHDQIFPQTTTVEYSSVPQHVIGYPNSTAAFLAKLGHNISYVAPGVSVSAVIGFRDGCFDPAADPRILGSGFAIVD